MKMLFALCALSLACATTPPPTPPPAPGPTCADLCAHYVALNCPAGQPTPTGIPCQTICENVQDGPQKMDLVCRVAATTCDAADACGAIINLQTKSSGRARMPGH